MRRYGNDNVQRVREAGQYGGEGLPALWCSSTREEEGQGRIGKWLLIVFAFGVVVAVLPKQDKAKASARVSPSAPQRT